MSAEANKIKFSLLHKASVSFEYLHTNSTTHEFIFGAIAELVDNSRDANATSLSIDFDEKHKTLSFLDDGVGMTPEETTKVVCFGHSLKRLASNKIGQYGNGLKSGAMRIAKDFMIFTKKSDYWTALLLSRTFHEKAGIKDILVPAPAFDDNFSPICDNAVKHNLEMDLIYQYSPFRTEGEIKEQFDKIDGKHGTMIVLFNLRRMENGIFELDFKKDKYDIGLSDHVAEREEERNSLRAYLSVLYLAPYTKIYLRGKKVNTVRIQNTLAYVCSYEYSARNLKSCAEKEYNNCIRRTKEIEEELKRVQSEYGEVSALSKKRSEEDGVYQLTKDEIAQQRRLNLKLGDLQEMLNECIHKQKKAAQFKKRPSPLTFNFGINIHHRNRYGCLIYNNGRLIDMYVKMAVQKESTDMYMKCLGVVGIVDIPYSVLEPTHNKQSFENKREYQSVLRAMNEHMESYWEDMLTSVIKKGANDVKHFWTPFGYDSCSYSAEPSNTFDFKEKRYNKTNHCIQCDLCLKWRVVEYHRKYAEIGIPEDWKCCNHPNTAMRSCEHPEQLQKLNHGKTCKLHRVAKKVATQNNSSVAPQNNITKATASPPIIRHSSMARPPMKRKQDPINESDDEDEPTTRRHSSRKTMKKEIISEDSDDSTELGVSRKRSLRQNKPAPPPVVAEDDEDDDCIANGRVTKRRQQNSSTSSKFENYTIPSKIKRPNRSDENYVSSTVSPKKEPSSDSNQSAKHVNRLQKRPVRDSGRNEENHEVIVPPRRVMPDSDEECLVEVAQEDVANDSAVAKKPKTKAELRKQLETASTTAPSVAAAPSLSIASSSKVSASDVTRSSRVQTQPIEETEIVKMKSQLSLAKQEIEDLRAKLALSAQECEGVKEKLSQEISSKEKQNKMREEAGRTTPNFSNGVYPTEALMIRDILMLLQWLDNSKTHEFSQNINVSTVYPMFREFCQVLHDAENPSELPNDED